MPGQRRRGPDGRDYEFDGQAWKALEAENPMRRVGPDGKQYDWNGSRWVVAGEPLFDEGDFGRARDEAVRGVVEQRGVFKGMQGRVRAAGQGAAQGYAASFADEAAGVAIPGLDASEADQFFAEAFEEHPASYGTGYVAGSVFGAPGRAFKAGSTAVNTAVREGGKRIAASGVPRLVRQILAGAGGGAAAGAVEGAGRAESESGLGERAAAAGEGAKWGAVVGGALPPAAIVAERAIGRPLISLLERMPWFKKLSPMTRERVDRVDAALATELQEAGLLRVTDDATKADAGPLNAAAREVNERSGVTSPSGRGSIAASEVSAAQRADVAAGEPARTVANVLNVAEREGAENVTQLVVGAAGKPGAQNVTRAYVRETTEPAQIAGRVWARLTRATGGLPSRADALEAISTTQRQLAEPLYQQLDQAPISLTPQLTEVMGAPAAQRAMAAAVRNAGNVIGQDPAAQATRNALSFIGKAPNGQYFVRDGAPATTWDLIKRAMDDRLWQSNAQRVKTGGGMAATEHARTVGVWRALVGEVDGQTGGLYQQARSTWAGDEAAKRAMDAGARILAPGDDVVWREASALWTPSEQLAAQVGAVQSMMNEVSRQPGAFLSRVRRDPGFQRRLRDVFGPKTDDILAGLQDELDAVTAAQRINPRAGSQTQPRMMADEAADRAVQGAGLDLAAGQSPWQLAVGVVRTLLAESSGMSPREAERIVRLASQPITEGRTSNALRAAMQRQQQRIAGPPTGAQYPAANVLADEPFTDRRRAENALLRAQ